MATTAKVKPTKRPAKRGAKASSGTQKSSLDYVQEAMKDLDRARGRAGSELRETLDTAIDRLHAAASGLRERAENEASELQQAYEQASEETRREYGRQAIMLQQSPEALSEMTAAIRKRRAGLAKAERGNGAA